jgi:uncharacterized protein DUF2804
MRSIALEPVPPAPMPLFRGTRPLKRWRYVALFCDELMACAASVHVGPARQTFWAVLVRDPESPLLERTRLLPRRGAVELSPGRLRVHDESARAAPGDAGIRGGLRSGPHGRRRGALTSSVALDFTLEEDRGIEALCPHGGAYVWTRKQAGISAHGTLALDHGPPRALEALAVIDDTAGYHARVTEWLWAAGVGVDTAGRPLAFNLVEGVNDPPSGSERAVWIAGKPHEVAPVRFAPDLTQIAGADGSELHFAAAARRERRENLVLVRSEYRAPFGVFSGTLPGGIPLARGLGVVEHHRARW